MEVLELEVKYSKTIQEKQFEPVNFSAKMKVTTEWDKYDRESINERKNDWQYAFDEVVEQVQEAISEHLDLEKPKKYKRGQHGQG